ncbi:tail fiber protein [Photorhabdus sp. RM71S]|uniref:tail fiber protein n=1 Tax=Photorhabdus sp. RM71S TaxID=3342824 RepID=UPI0036D9B41A
MEKKPNLSNAESNMENIKSNGPSADNLKKRFKEGSIPLQTDYADLINIADMGRRAVGKAPDQTDNPNSALVLNNNSGLAVKVNSSGGLQANKDGLSVKIKNKSLLTDNSGLAVNTGRGLKINNDKLEVDNHHGIEIVNEGVKVKANNGINVDSNGVSVKAGKGIKVDGSGVSLKMGAISVSTYSPLMLKEDILSVKLGNGLLNNSKGISVNPGNGITVDSNGVSINIQQIASALADLIIPSGTIVPFYSNGSLPNGWLWCDGTNGTPNLNKGITNEITLISGWIGKINSAHWLLNNVGYGDSEQNTKVQNGNLRISTTYTRYIMKK